MIDWYILSKVSQINNQRWRRIQGSDPPKSQAVMDQWLVTVSELTAITISSEGKDKFSVKGEINCKKQL